MRSRSVHITLASLASSRSIPLNAVEIKGGPGWNDRFVVGWQACLRRRGGRRGQKAITRTSLPAMEEPLSPPDERFLQTELSQLRSTA